MNRKEVKELLNSKGVLSKLESCRDEEEAVELLKRENLWGGVVDYPELEALKESYENGEIEADGNLSLRQLDKVAGGAQLAKGEHKKRIAMLDVYQFKALRERIEAIEASEEKSDVFREVLGEDETLDNEDIEEFRKAYEERLAEESRESEEKTKEEAPVEEVEAESQAKKGVSEEEENENREEDADEEMQQLDGKQVKLFKETTLKEKEELKEKTPKSEDIGVKSENDGERPVVEEPLSVHVEKEDTTDKKTADEESKETSTGDNGIEQTDKRQEDISEEVHGPKTFKDAINKKIKAGEEVKLELTSLGEELIFANKSYEDIIEAAKESEERIKVKELHDELMKETSQVPFPFEIESEEDYGEVPYDIFEDIVAHRGESTGPFLNEIRDLWKNKGELRGEIQRRIEEIGKLRSEGDSMAAKEETDELRRLVLENSIVESKVNYLDKPLCFTYDQLKEQLNKFGPPYCTKESAEKFIDKVETAFRLCKSNFVKNMLYSYLGKVIQKMLTSYCMPKSVHHLTFLLSDLIKHNGDLTPYIPLEYCSTFEIPQRNMRTSKEIYELLNPDKFFVKPQYKKQYMELVSETIANFPFRAQNDILNVLVPRMSFCELLSGQSLSACMDLERDIMYISSIAKVEVICHEFAHALLNYYIKNEKDPSKVKLLNSIPERVHEWLQKFTIERLRWHNICALNDVGLSKEEEIDISNGAKLIATSSNIKGKTDILKYLKDHYGVNEFRLQRELTLAMTEDEVDGSMRCEGKITQTYTVDESLSAAFFHECFAHMVQLLIKIQKDFVDKNGTQSYMLVNFFPRDVLLDVIKILTI